MTAQTQQQPKSGTPDWDEHGKHRGRVLHRESVAKNVYLYIVEKPEGFQFRPGQAVDLSIDEEGWRDKKRPFTITSLPNNPRLEFVIKSYMSDDKPGEEGVTAHLKREVEVGERVIFGDPWGAIEYRGPGVFIAGGAGITPFIAILRKLEQEQKLDGNRLFFSNKNAEVVFLQGELIRCLGNHVVCTLTGEEHRDYESGRVDKEWLKSRVTNFDQPFYLCGPPTMVKELSKTLQELGAKTDSLVFED